MYTKKNSTKIIMAITVAATLTCSAANAKHLNLNQGYYKGGSEQVFKRVVRDYSAKVVKGGRNYLVKIPKFVKQKAVKDAVKKAARTVGFSVGRSTAIGEVVNYFAFPKCAGERCR